MGFYGFCLFCSFFGICFRFVGFLFFGCFFLISLSPISNRSECPGMDVPKLSDRRGLGKHSRAAPALQQEAGEIRWGQRDISSFPKVKFKAAGGT